MPTRAAPKLPELQQPKSENSVAKLGTKLPGSPSGFRDGLVLGAGIRTLWLHVLQARTTAALR